jgi:hypothetical protein
VDATPAEAIAADADAVAQRLTARLHQIEPALGGVHDDGARGVIALEADGLARDRAGAVAAAIAEIGEEVGERRAFVDLEVLRWWLVADACIGRKRNCGERGCGKKESKKALHALVLCLFEGVATGAADGYGRMAGKPACTLLHLGPGYANGAANLHNARRAYTPIVNVIGDHATYHRGSTRR